MSPTWETQINSRVLASVWRRSGEGSSGCKINYLCMCVSIHGSIYPSIYLSIFLMLWLSNKQILKTENTLCILIAVLWVLIEWRMESTIPQRESQCKIQWNPKLFVCVCVLTCSFIMCYKWLCLQHRDQRWARTSCLVWFWRNPD